MTVFFRKGLVSLSAAALLVSSSCESPKEPAQIQTSINIGLITPPETSLEGCVEQAESAATGLEEEINQRGGIKGESLSIIIETPQSAFGGNLLAAQNLVGMGVPAIVAGYDSNSAVAIARYVERANTVFISPTASQPALTHTGSYVFRTIGSDTIEARFAANYTFKELQIRKVGVVSSGRQYSVDLSRAFQEEFESLGGEVTGIAKFEPYNYGFRSQLGVIGERGAELIYIGTGLEPNTEIIPQEIALAKLDALILASTRTLTTDNASAFSSYSLGVMYVRDRFETDELFYLCRVHTYDSLMLIVNAIEAVGKDPEEIKSYLSQVREYHGLSGLISFDKNGDNIAFNYTVEKRETGTN